MNSNPSQTNLDNHEYKKDYEKYHDNEKYQWENRFSELLILQERMKTSGCLSSVTKVLWATSNPEIKILCYKIITNISTNPDMLEEIVKVRGNLYFTNYNDICWKWAIITCVLYAFSVLKVMTLLKFWGYSRIT